MIASVARIRVFLLESTGDIASHQLKNVDVSFVAAGITVHRETIDGRDVLWASPRDNDRGHVKGLLFLAHGCGHSNLDWFSKATPECEDCVGLPEETAIVKTALDMGLVAIATSASSWSTKCWTGLDITPVALVLNELWHRFSLEEGTSLSIKRRSLRQTDLSQPVRLPLYAFGASSGGAFVSMLASPLLSRFGIRLDGFVSQIAAHLPTYEEEEKDPHKLCKVYVTMNKDIKTDRAAEARVHKCVSEDEHDRCKHIRLPDLPIHPSYFADRISGISTAESFEMVKVLTKGGFLNPETGELIVDPRKNHEDWSRTLHQASSPALTFTKGDSLVADQSPIFEVLNVAWGYHEMAREGVQEALEFCMQQQ